MVERRVWSNTLRSMTMFLPPTTAMPCRPFRRNVESWIQTLVDSSAGDVHEVAVGVGHRDPVELDSLHAGNLETVLVLELGDVRRVRDARVRVRALHHHVADDHPRTAPDPPVRPFRPAALRREHRCVLRFDGERAIREHECSLDTIATLRAKSHDIAVGHTVEKCLKRAVTSVPPVESIDDGTGTKLLPTRTTGRSAYGCGAR